MSKSRRSRRSKQTQRQRSKSRHSSSDPSPKQPAQLTPHTHHHPSASGSSISDQGGGWPVSAVADWAASFLYTRQTSVSKRSRKKRSERSGSMGDNNSAVTPILRSGSAPPSFAPSPFSSSSHQSKQAYSELVLSPRPSSYRFDIGSSPMWLRKMGPQEAKERPMKGDMSPSRESFLSHTSSIESTLSSGQSPKFRLVNKVESLVRHFTDASQAATLAKAEAEDFLSVINGPRFNNKLQMGGHDRAEKSTRTRDAGTQTFSQEPPPHTRENMASSSQSGFVQTLDSSPISFLPSLPSSSVVSLSSPPQPQQTTETGAVRPDASNNRPNFSEFYLNPFRAHSNRQDGDDSPMSDIVMSRRPTGSHGDAMMTSSPPLSPRAIYGSRRGTTDTVIGPTSSSSSPPGLVTPLPQHWCKMGSDLRTAPFPDRATLGPIDQPFYQATVPAPTSYGGLFWIPPTSGHMCDGGPVGGVFSGCVCSGIMNPGTNHPALTVKQEPQTQAYNCFSGGHTAPLVSPEPAARGPSTSCSYREMSHPPQCPSLPQHPPGSWVPASVFVKLSQACAEFVTAVYTDREERYNDRTTPPVSGVQAGCVVTSPSDSLPSGTPTSLRVVEGSNQGNKFGVGRSRSPQSEVARSDFGSSLDLDRMEVSSSMMIMDD